MTFRLRKLSATEHGDKWTGDNRLVARRELALHFDVQALLPQEGREASAYDAADIDGIGPLLEVKTA